MEYGNGRQRHGNPEAATFCDLLKQAISYELPHSLESNYRVRLA